nr:hypothetical protein [Tanacetum cinerariifolium]
MIPSKRAFDYLMINIENIQSVVEINRRERAENDWKNPITHDVKLRVKDMHSSKNVSFQSPKESVGSNDMINNNYLEEAKKKAQIQKDKALNTKSSVQYSASLPNTTNGSKLKPRNSNEQSRNCLPSMSSRVSNRDINISELPRNFKPFFKSKYLACTTRNVTPPTTHVDTTLTPIEIPIVSPIVSPSPDYTASLDYSPTSDTEFDLSEDPSSDRIPPLPAISPFLSSTDDSSDSNAPNTLLSPTYDDLSDSSSGHSSSDHSSPALPLSKRSSHQLCSALSIPYSSAAITERPSHSSFTGPSLKRGRSPTIFIHISSYVLGALSSVRADLLPTPKRIRSFDSMGSDEPYLEPDIDPEIQAEINECIAYADALRDEGIDARVMIETVPREEAETSTRGLVKIRVDRVMHPTML